MITKEEIREILSIYENTHVNEHHGNIDKCVDLIYTYFEPRSAHLEFFGFINALNQSVPSLNPKYYNMLLDMLIELKKCSKNKSRFECNFSIGKIIFELR